MEITAPFNGSLNFPLAMTYEEIGFGIRFTGTVAQCNIELAGMTFTPENTGSPPEPQNGTIDILVDDQDGGTPNATHTITIEVLRRS
jgi:hypothetical protein